MELLSIEHINENYLFYETLRGAKKWLSKKGLLIVRIGRKYYVRHDEFMQALQNLMPETPPSKPITKAIKHKPESEYEKAIYKNLIKKIDGFDCPKERTVYSTPL